jgi:hypothetical protein
MPKIGMDFGLVSMPMRMSGLRGVLSFKSPPRLARSLTIAQENPGGRFPLAKAWPRRRWPLCSSTLVAKGVLVLNAGSSSVKFALFERENG